MPRNANPAPVHWFQGVPVVNGQMFYFESGTNTIKTTFADVSEIISNPNPVLLDAGGREPNIFFSGSAKQILKTAAGVQVFERDPVGGQSQLGNFSDYDNGVIYGINDIIEATDGNFYLSLSNGNQGNDPTDDDDTDWEQIQFLKTAIYQDSGATLSLYRINSLTDASTFKLPVATTIKDKQVIFVNLPDRFSSNQPIVEVENVTTDTMTDIDGTDINLKFDGGSQGIWFVKNGANNWDLHL